MFKLVLALHGNTLKPFIAVFPRLICLPLVHLWKQFYSLDGASSPFLFLSQPILCIFCERPVAFVMNGHFLKSVKLIHRRLKNTFFITVLFLICKRLTDFKLLVKKLLPHVVLLTIK